MTEPRITLLEDIPLFLCFRVLRPDPVALRFDMVAAKRESV